MRFQKVGLFVLAALPSRINTASSFSLGSIFGNSEEEPDSSYPQRNLIEEFGEEGYKRVLVEAFGEELDENGQSASFPKIEYGVDLSYPIHNAKTSSNFDWLPHNIDPENNAVPANYRDMPVQYFGDKQSLYDESMQGCRDFYSHVAYVCDQTEKDRIQMNLRQPKSMQVS